MFYGNKKFIRAHQDIRVPYYNHSYDREVRDALCSGCGKIIGEQIRYPEFDRALSFKNEKDLYIYCPYCGHKFEK